MPANTYTFLLLSGTLCFFGCYDAGKHPSRHRNMRKIFAVKQLKDEQYKNNRATNRLVGKVQRVEQFQYNDVSATDTTSVPFALKEYLSFDKAGNMVERIIYDSIGFDSRNVYMFDASGKTIRIGNYAEDGAFRFTQYNTFDTAGNLLAKGERHADGSIVNEEVFEYDEYGQKVTWIKPGKELPVKFKNQYDEEGLLAQQEIFYREGGNADGRTVWKYDNLGNTIEEAHYVGDEHFSTLTTEYNRRRQPVRMTKLDRDGTSRTIQCSYDAHGSAVEEIQRDNDTGMRIQLYKHRYVYDKTGNWTRSELIDGKGHSVQVVIRKILYYQE